LHKTTAGLLMMAMLATSAAAEEPLTLKQTVELAVRHQSASREAQMDIARAKSNARVAKAAWLPTVYAGSGLGYSYGSPAAMGGNAPTIFSVSSTQYLLNEPARWQRKALAAESEAAEIAQKERAEAAAAEAAELYLRLSAALEEELAAEGEQQSATKLLATAKARRAEGLDSELDGKRAELIAARAGLRRMDAASAIALLKLQLSAATGLSLEAIDPPAGANVEPPEMVAAEAKSFAELRAEAQARAAEMRAKGEASGWLPTVDLAGQYAMLSKFNNYDEYYRKFSRNNFSIGVEVRVPIFNLAQRERAKAARLEAEGAKARVEDARRQTAVTARKAGDAAARMKAVARVRALEAEVAEGEAAEAQARLGEGGSLRELESAEIEAMEKHAEARAAALELKAARLQWLTAVGGVRAWAEK